MPNAHEYRDAAAQLRRIALQLVDDAALVRPAAEPDELAGGALAAVLDRALDAYVRHVELAREELARVASVCETRAEICDQFATALRRHARLARSAATWSGESWTPPPSPPARWVRP